jgi:hypothetical protein
MRKIAEKGHTIATLKSHIKKMQTAMREHAHGLDTEAASFDVSLIIGQGSMT